MHITHRHIRACGSMAKDSYCILILWVYRLEIDKCICFTLNYRRVRQVLFYSIPIQLCTNRSMHRHVKRDDSHTSKYILNDLGYALRWPIQFSSDPFEDENRNISHTTSDKRGRLSCNETGIGIINLYDLTSPATHRHRMTIAPLGVQSSRLIGLISRKFASQNFCIDAIVHLWIWIEFFAISKRQPWKHCLLSIIMSKTKPAKTRILG